MTRRSGRRRGLLALPANIADRQSPACWRAVGVVKVGADLDAVGRRDVRRGELDAGDFREPSRQQAGLQGIRDLYAAADQLVDPDGQRELLAEFLDKPEVCDLEVALPGAPGQS